MLDILLVVDVGQFVYSTASVPHVPEHEELEAVLRDDGDGMALLGDRTAELLYRIVVELAEGVKVGGLLVIKEGGRCPLPEGKDSLEHRDGVVTNVCIEVVVLVRGRILIVVFVLLVTEEIKLIIIVIITVVRGRWWGFLGIHHGSAGGASSPGLSCPCHWDDEEGRRLCGWSILGQGRHTGIHTGRCR